MELLQSIERSCPYCGEMLELLIDCSVDEQCYVEDCAVCCQPMVVDVRIEEDALWVNVEAEGR